MMNFFFQTFGGTCWETKFHSSEPSLYTPPNSTSVSVGLRLDPESKQGLVMPWRWERERSVVVGVRVDTVHHSSRHPLFHTPSVSGNHGRQRNERPLGLKPHALQTQTHRPPHATFSHRVAWCLRPRKKGLTKQTQKRRCFAPLPLWRPTLVSLGHRPSRPPRVGPRHGLSQCESQGLPGGSAVSLTGEPGGRGVRSQPWQRQVGEEHGVSCS